MDVIREGSDRIATVGDLTYLVHGVTAEPAGIRASLTIRRGADVLVRDCVPLWSPRRRKDLTAAFCNGEAEQVDRALVDLEAALAEQQAHEPEPERPPIVADMIPWPEAVDGGRLLAILEDGLRRFVVMERPAYVTCSLWVVAAHALKAFDLFPMLAVQSPVKRCGKTTLLSALTRLLPRPLATSNISTASVYRAVEEFAPSLVVDEADTFTRDNPELTGILNSGHSRDLAFVVRTVGEGEDQHPARFSTWCPKVVAAIGKLPETWEDRSVIITMRRRAKAETVERCRRGALDPLLDVGRMAARWADDHIAELADATPTIPDELDDRAADNWEALLAVADLVGDPWSGRARKAALALSGGRDAEDDGVGIRLLRHIHQVFEEQKADRLSSADIVGALTGEEEWGWSTWRKGRPLDQRGLGTLLRPFSIRSKQVWVANANVRGFEKAQFADSWSRYLALYPLGPLDRNDDTELDSKSHPLDDSILADRKQGITPEQQSTLADLADKNPENGEQTEMFAQWEEV